MKNAIMLVGEAWGEAEERARMPFVGPSGYHLNLMLTEAGIRKTDCYLTNVFNFRPPSNRIGALCTSKANAIPNYPALNVREGIEGGSYVHKKYTKELERLADELDNVDPNVVVALGNTAMWALLGKSMITKARGVVQMSTHTVTGYKVLPTYHPAAITRQWNWRPVAVADLMKAKRESAYPEIRRLSRKIWIDPTLEDIYEFDRDYIQPCETLAVDIETVGSVIACIGFAPSPTVAIVIPGIGTNRARRAYWPSLAVEREVYKVIKDILRRPTPKVFQNGLYDVAFLWRSLRIGVHGFEHDTMLLHHALQPESLKGLGFLGSVYTDEGPWKQMRVKTTIKRED